MALHALQASPVVSLSRNHIFKRTGQIPHQNAITNSRLQNGKKSKQKGKKSNSV